MKIKPHYLHLVLFAFCLIVIDQASKIYIKTHFNLGDEIKVFDSWFRIHFIENDGMAYGLKFSDGAWAKIALSLFRVGAIAFGIYYLIKKILPRQNVLFNYVVVLILSGAVGNLIDSLFYGLIFTESYYPFTQPVITQPALFSLTHNYGYFLGGKVVDMLYFPLIQTTLPQWIPVFGGQDFEFFSPIFNIADSCISIGIFIFIIFNKSFMRFLNHTIDIEAQNKDNTHKQTETQHTNATDTL